MLNTVILKKSKEKRILSGHPWIYDSEIEKIEDGCIDGEVVFVSTHSLRKIGIGYINRKSKITIRILDFLKNEKENLNLDNILKNKILNAIKKRSNIKNTDAMRLIFSEADALPGLIVDKYANLLVVQITTLGMEKLKKKIISILDKELNPEFIYEKSISEARKLEGLERKQGMIKPEDIKVPEIIIDENGIKFKIMVDKGSKTGFYLDQRENREKLRDFSEGKKVLDCFCYTGGFSVYALKSGAQYTSGIDISEGALKMAEENMKLNGLKNYEFIKSDVFDILVKLCNKKEKFDIIILDPPPFSKTEKEKRNALKGYDFLHRKSFEILNRSGFLFSFSCSQNIQREDLLQIINTSAAKTRTLIEIVDFLTQANDHPYSKIIPETFYLKGVIVKKL